MKTAKEIADALLFDPSMNGMQPVRFAQSSPLPPSFSQPPVVPMPQARPQMAPQAVPMPAPRPQVAPQAAASMAAAPMSPQQASPFNGQYGPQWTDQQWQDYWARSNPTG